MTQRRKQVQVEDWKPESGALFKAYVRCMAFRFTTQCTENRAFCTVSTIVSGHQPHTLDLPPAALLWWDPALITDAQKWRKQPNHCEVMILKFEIRQISTIYLWYMSCMCGLPYRDFCLFVWLQKPKIQFMILFFLECGRCSVIDHSTWFRVLAP